MKKFLFLGLAAMMAFTSCTKDETLATAQNGAIGFDVAADKATRSNVDPSTTTANITNFNVYGFMNQVDGIVFATTGEKVTGSNAAGWTYTNTQYWTPNTYYFAAIAPAENPAWKLTPATDDAKAKLGVGVIDFTNAGAQDLLYWAGISDNTQGAAEDAPVAIKFNHLLSKVKFSFVNDFDNANAQVEVLDIQITNAESEGTIDLSVENWWDGDDWTVKTPVAFEFGDANSLNNAKVADTKFAPGVELESDNEMLLFPVNGKEFNITFKVNLYMNGVLANAKPYEHTVQVTTTLEMGKAYDFKAVLDASNVTGDDAEALKPIEFTVTVIEWEQAGEVDVKLNEEHNNVTVAAGETMTLACNGTINGTMKVAGTLDGNGHTLAAADAPTNDGLVRPTGANATIQNVTIDGKGLRTTDNKALRGLFFDQVEGEYVVDNVHVYGVVYALNVNTTKPVKLTVKNSTLEGWTSFGNSTTATFEKVSFENGQYANFKPYTTVTLTDCTFEEGFALDFSALNGKMILKNCKCGDTVITAENIATCGVVLDTFDAAKVEF